MGCIPYLFDPSSLLLQRKNIKTIMSGVTQVKHHQPLLLISCNLLDITARDGNIVKGLYIKVSSPTSSTNFANGINSEKGNVLILIKFPPKALSMAIMII